MSFARSACLLALLLGACAGSAPLATPPLTEDVVRRAAERLQAFAQRRGDVALLEAGLQAPFYTWRYEERFEDPAPFFDPWLRSGLPPAMPRRVRERVLVGPASRVLAWRTLRAVRVHRWLLEAGVELDVEGEPEPWLLRVDDDEAAPLAEALDVLRRAGRQPAPRGAASSARRSLARWRPAGSKIG